MVAVGAAAVTILYIDAVFDLFWLSSIKSDYLKWLVVHCCDAGQCVWVLFLSPSFYAYTFLLILLYLCIEIFLYNLLMHFMLFIYLYAFTFHIRKQDRLISMVNKCNYRHIYNFKIDKVGNWIFHFCTQ